MFPEYDKVGKVLTKDGEDIQDTGVRKENKAIFVVDTSHLLYKSSLSGEHMIPESLYTKLLGGGTVCELLDHCDLATSLNLRRHVKCQGGFLAMDDYISI